MPGRKTRLSPPTLALYGRWSGTPNLGAGARVEAGEEEWFWGAPMPDGTYSAAAFIEPSRGRDAGGKLETLYRSLLAGSALLRECLRGELIGGVEACDASAYVVENPVEEHFIRVGDASLGLDPLCSQGVQEAISSGLQGSIVVHTLLARPKNSDAALRFYRERRAEAVARHSHLAGQFYGEVAAARARPFWSARARAQAVGQHARYAEAEAELRPQAEFPPADCRLVVSPAVGFVATPCVVGDIVAEVRSVSHPELGRPVAFVGGVKVSPLLDAVASGGTAAEIAHRWRSLVTPRRGLELIRWMYNSHLIIPARPESHTTA
jgi:hypothetical protein